MTAEFARHAETHVRYGARLDEEFPEFQLLVRDGEEVVAHARTLPLRWDGTLDDLPRGIDGTFERAFAEREGNVLCAVQVTVVPERRGEGWSRRALGAMLDLARRRSLETLIAPVMPTAKHRYPITPIERYAQWRRDDGLLFDPWLRTHERLGAEVLKPEPQSVRITGSVAGWERWVGLQFPETGNYVIPRGLAPLAIDHERDVGVYYEPNVWMRHAVRRSSP